MRQSRDLADTFKVRTVGLKLACSGLRMTRRTFLTTAAMVLVSVRFAGARQEETRPMLLIDGWVLRAGDPERLANA
jgi:hypothetical protein